MERTAHRWRCGPHTLECGPRTLVMGILNVTPDSFSDGGRFFDPEAAVARGMRMVAEGADVLDVGGESTRPGSDQVAAAEERDRVVPIVKRLAAEVSVPVSIDTRKAEVAAAALEVGATIVNDVTAGRDPAMFGVVRDSGAGLVLMHMKGEPKTMQEDPRYEDVVAEVRDYLRDRAAAAEAAGIAPDRLCVDPGLGFSKATPHSLRLMKENAVLAELGYPVLVGPSRKSFIGDALGGLTLDRRLAGTMGAVAYLAANGAHIVRVHDVREHVELLRVVDAILAS
ncbi:MAG: dihydropteroate synthase [Actinomycetota bacterium]